MTVPLTMDAMLADRLTGAFGSLARASAFLRLANRSSPGAMRRISGLIGSKPHFASDGDQFLETPAHATAVLEIGGGYGWNGREVLAPQGRFPETLRAALAGRPAGDLLAHPGIPADLTLSVPDENSPDEAVMVIEDAPIVQATDTRLDRAAAHLSLFFFGNVPERLRHGYRTTTPRFRNTIGLAIPLTWLLLLAPFGFHAFWWRIPSTGGWHAAAVQLFGVLQTFAALGTPIAVDAMFGFALSPLAVGGFLDETDQELDRQANERVERERSRRGF